MGPKSIGVVNGSSPAGPFSDPLGAPLIPEGLVPTYSRDPGVLMDDDGSNYLIFGTFSYYMARLAPDMISLAEELRPVQILGQQHRDDKPFLHKRGATLSTTHTHRRPASRSCEQRDTMRSTACARTN